MTQICYRKTALAAAIAAVMLAATGVSTYARAEPADSTLPVTEVAVPQSTTNTTSNNSKKKPATLQTVEVTGTHIRQVDLATQEPITTITHEQIVRAGLITVGQVLNRMTTTGVSGLNAESVQSPDSINQGGSFVNLRYLGSSRVLVLVNGKRWVTNPDGSTDLSSIPTAAISRIEVLKDGASAIYGSDAISGVINIITRKRFNGAQLNVGYGQTDIGDSQQPHASLMLGTTSDKSSLLMDVSFASVGAMWDRSRAITASGEGGPYHPTSAYYQSSPRGMFTDSNGTFMLNKLGDDTSDIANYTKVNPFDLPVSDTYDQFNQGQFRIPSKQTSLYVSGSHDVTNNITLTANGMYTERRNVSEIGPFPLSAGIFQGLGGEISANSIYNPTDQNVTFRVIYPNLPRITTHLVRSMHFDTGLNGVFNFANMGQWNWDAYINFNKQSGVNTLHNQINLQFLQNGIGPSFINDEGVPTCGAPGAPVGNPLQNPCIPINVLAGPDGLTSDIEKNLVINPDYTFQFTDKGVAADITGPLFKIPFGGHVAVAAGVAVRKETGFSRMELFKQLALTTSAAGGDTNGEFTVRSEYMELNVPLVENLPGIELLDFDIAARHSNYSNFGSTTNKKIGFQYKPFHDLLFRGTYATAFRAPTIDDFAGGDVNGYSSYTDPCDAKFGVAVYGLQLHDACVAQLVKMGISNPTEFRELSHDGSPITFPGEETGELSTAGPSPDLRPETATTLTYGFVYSPHQVPGLSTSINWWTIRLRNIITGISGDDVLRGCYQGVQLDCASFSRDPISGQVINMFTGLTNEGWEKVQGEDFTISYRLPPSRWGQFMISNDTTYYNHMELEQTAGAPVDQLIGWADQWRIRSNTTLSWSKNRWHAMWRVRYFSSLKEPCAFATTGPECNEPNHVDPFNGALPTNRIGDTAYNDASVTWTGGAVGNVTLGVDNIFDREPPIAYGQAAGDAPIIPNYDLGRFWFMNYQVKF